MIIHRMLTKSLVHYRLAMQAQRSELSRDTTMAQSLNILPTWLLARVWTPINTIVSDDKRTSYVGVFASLYIGQ